MKTADLAVVRNYPRQFTWGPILEFYDISSRYTIARYEAATGEGFHVWVEGQDTCHGFYSLDAALAGAIAYRHEGVNHQADTYFMKMIEPREAS